MATPRKSETAGSEVEAAPQPELVSILVKVTKPTRAALKVLSAMQDTPVNDILVRLVNGEVERNREALNAVFGETK